MHKTRNFLRKKIWIIVCLFLCLLTLSTLFFFGIIWPNKLFVGNYPVRGIDVSSYQGQIDWKSVAQTHTVTFAYIKATEGKNYQDAYFQNNWRETQDNGILRGAYHYFSDNRTGAEQAKNFIGLVPKDPDMLPPVLDMEVSGQDHNTMIQEIKVFLDSIQQHYGIKPIIYTDQQRYTEYIQGNFASYTIWIRNVLTPVQWMNIKNWDFWQYCDHCYVAGISGAVDLNVFAGTNSELKQLTRQSAS